MTDPYTPTTEEVRALYVDMTEGHREDDPDEAARGAEFDRFIAQVREEGAKAALLDAATEFEGAARAGIEPVLNRLAGGLLRRRAERQDARRRVDAALAGLLTAGEWLPVEVSE